MLNADGLALALLASRVMKEDRRVLISVDVIKEVERPMKKLIVNVVVVAALAVGATLLQACSNCPAGSYSVNGTCAGGYGAGAYGSPYGYGAMPYGGGYGGMPYGAGGYIP